MEAFLWRPGQGMIGLGDLWGFPHAAGSIGYDINNLGQVVGSAASPIGDQGFLWDPVEGMIGLGLPPDASYSRGHAVNDHGVVLGSYREQPSDYSRTFVWDRVNGMRRLNSCLDASGKPPYHNISGSAINNSGQIVGHASGPEESVLLTPFLLADMNCDGSLNSFDIQRFVLTLQWLSGDDAARKEYEQTYPGCHGDWAADANQDGSVNPFDIQPFIDLLSG